MDNNNPKIENRQRNRTSNKQSERGSMMALNCLNIIGTIVIFVGIVLLSN